MFIVFAIIPCSLTVNFSRCFSVFRHVDSVFLFAGVTELSLKRISRPAAREWHCVEHPEASVVVSRKQKKEDAAAAAATASASSSSSSSTAEPAKQTA
jgi:hypothetical protein